MGNNLYVNDFSRQRVFEQMDELDDKLAEEQAKEPNKRDSNKEFELIYAKFIAGLKLNTGYRIF